MFLVNGTAEGVKVSSLRHNPSSVPRIKVPKLLCSGGGSLESPFHLLDIVMRTWCARKLLCSGGVP